MSLKTISHNSNYASLHMLNTLDSKTSAVVVAKVEELCLALAYSSLMPQDAE